MIRGAAIRGVPWTFGLGFSGPGEGFLRAAAWDERRTSWCTPVAGSESRETQIAVRGPRLYVVNDGHLHAIEAADGSSAWSTEVSGKGLGAMAHAFGSHGDELGVWRFPGAEATIVVAWTRDGELWAWDDGTGRRRWFLPPSRGTVHKFGSRHLIRLGRTAELVDVTTGEIVGRLDAYRSMCVGAAKAMVAVDVDIDGWDRTRYRLWDGEDLSLSPDTELPDLDLDPAAFSQRHLYAWLDTAKGSRAYDLELGKASQTAGFFARFFGKKGPGTTRRVGVAGMGCAKISTFGAVVVFDLVQLSGGMRQVVVVDGSSFTPVHDSGLIPDRPGEPPLRVQGDDDTLVYAHAPTDDPRRCELRSIDREGRELWSRAVGSWKNHDVRDGIVTVHHIADDDRFRVSFFDARTGQLMNPPD